jgi:hypothetical protein
MLRFKESRVVTGRKEEEILTENLISCKIAGVEHWASSPSPRKNLYV